MSQYMTVEEVARAARASTKTVRRAVAAGALRASRPARRLLFRPEDVRRWVESRSA